MVSLIEQGILNMYINQQDVQNSVIRLYFPLDAQMFRTILVHHQEQLLISCTSHLVYAYSHTTARRVVPAYTKCDVQLIKVAPDDGLI